MVLCVCVCGCGVVWCGPCVCLLLQGCEVEVQLKEGEVYEGVLRTISPNMEISLSVVHFKGKVQVYSLYVCMYMYVYVYVCTCM